MSALQPLARSPFETIGGAAGVRRLVERFYDLMGEEAAFADLRALHQVDLGPMRASLTGFLTAWLGGPRDWMASNPGKCMMSVHAPFAIDAQVARQWVEAMTAAMHDTDVDAALARQMADAFGKMAANMVNR